MKDSPRQPIMYSVDIDPNVASVAANHKVIIKDAYDLTCIDINQCDPRSPLGLVFFDCHDYEAQMHVYNTLFKSNTIANSTVIAVHDTGVWPLPFATTHCDGGRKWVSGPGYLHQVPERKMVNSFIELGYHCINLFPSNLEMFGGLPDNLQFRFGVSICQRNTILNNEIKKDSSDVVINYEVEAFNPFTKENYIRTVSLPKRYDIMETEAFLRAFCSENSIIAEQCSNLLDKLVK